MIAECADSSLPNPDPQLQGDEEYCGVAGGSPRLSGLGYCCYCKVRQLHILNAVKVGRSTGLALAFCAESATWWKPVMFLFHGEKQTNWLLFSI